MKRVVACLLFSLLAVPASAGEIAGGFDLGLGVLDSDFYAAASAYVSYRTEGLHLGGQLPLRVMLTGDDAPRVRRQDWDEVSDFTKLLRYFDWQPSDAVHVRLGEPTGVTMGHGAIVDHYYNATDLDHYKTSLRASWQGTRFGLDFFNNDITRWEIMAGRVSFKPMGGTASWIRDLQVAFTLAMDRAAPLGSPAGTDETNQPIVLRAPIWLYGMDVDVPLWRGAQRQVLLYTDVVGMSHNASFNGALAQNTGGWHLGVRLELPAVAPSTDLTVKLEGLYMGHGYLPGDLDNLYEVERFQAQAAQNVTTLTKVGWALENSGSLGVRTQIDLAVEKGVKFTALLGWLGHDGLSTQLWLATPEMSGLTLRAHWGQQHVQAAADLGAMDRTSALAELRYRIGAALSVVLQGGTRWQAKDPEGYAARREFLGAARLEWKM